MFKYIGYKNITVLGYFRYSHACLIRLIVDMNMKILVYIHVIKFKEKEKKINSLILYTFLFF